jgi:hypothetical protein
VSLDKLLTVRQRLTMIRCRLERRFQTADFVPDRYVDPVNAHALASEICQEVMSWMRATHEQAEKAEQALELIIEEMKT